MTFGPPSCLAGAARFPSVGVVSQLTLRNVVGSLDLIHNDKREQLFGQQNAQLFGDASGVSLLGTTRQNDIVCRLEPAPFESFVPFATVLAATTGLVPFPFGSHRKGFVQPLRRRPALLELVDQLTQVIELNLQCPDLRLLCLDLRLLCLNDRLGLVGPQLNIFE